MKMESRGLYTKIQACLSLPGATFYARVGLFYITHTHTHIKTHIIAASHFPLPAVDHKIFTAHQESDGNLFHDDILQPHASTPTCVS
jgi:hypothetical protein